MTTLKEILDVEFKEAALKTNKTLSDIWFIYEKALQKHKNLDISETYFEHEEDEMVSLDKALSVVRDYIWFDDISLLYPALFLNDELPSSVVSSLYESPSSHYDGSSIDTIKPSGNTKPQEPPVKP